MAKFKVEWKSGKTVEIERSDCATVEAFKNSYFGRGTEVDAKVELVTESKVEVKLEAKPAAKKAAK
jgi:hypothetical protein